MRLSESTISIVPETPTTVTTLSSRPKPRSTWSGVHGFCASFSAKQNVYLPGWPSVAMSISPGRAPPTFCNVRRTARPMVALARLPGPNAFAAAFMPISRVPTRSAGTRSGVNWMRRKVPPTTVATVLMARVLASPGTPSSRMCPRARSATIRRSTRWSCPTMTRLISLKTCFVSVASRSSRTATSASGASS